MTTAAILTALRELGGKATLGDLMWKTRLSAGEIEPAILPALSEVQGHVAVDEKGELLYYLPRRARRHETLPLQKAWTALYLSFQVCFFVSLTLVFAAYTLVYLVVLIAAAIAASDGCCCDACSCCTCDCPRGFSAKKEPDLGAKHG